MDNQHEIRTHLTSFRLTRKLILIISMVGMALCYAVLGACFYIRAGHRAEAQVTGLPVEDWAWGWVPPTAIGAFLEAEI